MLSLNRENLEDFGRKLQEIHPSPKDSGKMLFLRHGTTGELRRTREKCSRYIRNRDRASDEADKHRSGVAKSRRSVAN